MTHVTPPATVHVAVPADEPAPSTTRWRPGRTSTATLLALATLATGALSHGTATATALALSTAAVGWGGAPVFRDAWTAVRRATLTTDVLPAAGLLAVFGAAVWTVLVDAAGPVTLAAAATATALLLAGRGTDRLTERRAGAALDTLAAGPATVTALRAGRVEAVPVGLLTTGDRFAVASGEAVAVAAVVLDGHSAVQVDGTDTPHEVGMGDAVPAGARNAGNRLVMAATGPGFDAGPPATEARRGAAVLQGLADRAADGFACVVVVVAVAVLGFRIGAGAGIVPAIGTAAAVLLATCPRTAGRATATAMLAATGRAAELGAVPAGPRVLERAARVDTVVLCRTGTVTAGIQQLRTVHVTGGVDADEALRLAGAVATAAQEAAGASDEPVVAVLAPEARARFGELPGVAEFDHYPALGMRGMVTELCTGPDGDQRVMAHATLLGHPALLDAHGIALPADLAAALERIHASGATAVTVSWDGVARAVLEIDDPVREESVAVVRGLRELGLTPVLLAGDDAGAAQGLAGVLGVEPDDVLASSGDGSDAVAALRSRGRTVAVLGGPADAPALAAADVALVRPDGGAPRLAGPASIALRDDDPLTAVDALRLMRRSVRTVERLVVATVAYHLIVLPLAATGMLPPVVAAAAAAAWTAGAGGCAAALRRVRPLPRS
jgi:Cu+-exporting ATPase